MKRSLWMRVDGNAVIGLGHIHRCLALTEMLNGAFDIKFVIHTSSANQMQLIRQHGHEVKIISGEDQLIKMALPGDLVVLDGYEFDHALQVNLKAKGAKLVCIDDETVREFSADVILNPAGGIDRSAYRKKDHALLFTGPKYILLRSAFLNPPPAKEVPKGSVLACFGGADPENFSFRVCKNLLKRKDIHKVILVTGASYSFRDSLAALEKEYSKTFIVKENLSAAELAALYTSNETVITSSSTVACEAASCAAPLIVIKTAANQENLYNFLVNEHLALPLLSPEELEKDENDLLDRLKKERNTQAEEQKYFFDHLSPRRIQQIFASLDSKLTYRPLKSSDSALIFSWANDPLTRNNSFHQEAITQEAHEEWFKKKLSDPDATVELFFLGENPAGMVRIESVKKEYVVSLNVAPDHRGQGLGAQMLRLALVRFFSGRPEEALQAYIKKENEASKKVFSAAGFIFAEELKVAGQAAVRMICKW